MPSSAAWPASCSSVPSQNTPAISAAAPTLRLNCLIVQSGQHPILLPDRRGLLAGRLQGQQALEFDDLVAQEGGLLEFKLARRLFHLRFQLLDHAIHLGLRH